nr:MAG TPA: Protein of unknown function (DUF2774) [Caudoviricetes sp.]
MTSRAEQVRMLRLAGLSFADIAARLGLASPDEAVVLYESVASLGTTAPFHDARPHALGGGAPRPHPRGPVAQGHEGRPRGDRPDTPALRTPTAAARTA